MDKVITLDYGSGGAKTSELIESLVVPSFDNEALHDLPDAASLKGNERLGSLSLIYNETSSA